MFEPISKWGNFPQKINLAAGYVHVWRLSLQLPDAQFDYLDQVLSNHEREYAATFRFPAGRRRFTVARAALRLLLAHLLSWEPGMIRFSCNNFGKPALEGDYGLDLSFNLSHSQDLALIAVARERTVGIDLEEIRDGMAGDAIARRFFSPTEVEILQALPSAERRRAFFRCWTRKEAYVKARGMGLSLGLANFDVSLAPGEPAALTGSREQPSPLGNWEMIHLEPGENFIGALVVETPVSGVSGWNWDWDAIPGLE